MGVSPILTSAMIQRTDDISVIKHQQDARPAVEQQNAMTQVNKKVDEMRHQVIHKNNADKSDTHADAREEGKNKYFFQKKETKKNVSKTTEDRVVKKTLGGSFDIKV